MLVNLVGIEGALDCIALLMTSYLYSGIIGKTTLCLTNRAPHYDIPPQ